MAEENMSNDSLDADYEESYMLDLNDGEINEQECIKEPQPWIITTLIELI